MSEALLSVKNLRKHFALKGGVFARDVEKVHAVDGVSFAVPEGSVMGVLGPNGAGKTTTVRMLTTMSVPTSGTGRVAGHDIITDPDAVRRSMGLTGQSATVDELLTGRENIRLIGRFAGLSGSAVKKVGDDLLERRVGLPLLVQVLDDGLDHEIAVLHRLE